MQGEIENRITGGEHTVSSGHGKRLGRHLCAQMAATLEFYQLVTQTASPSTISCSRNYEASEAVALANLRFALKYPQLVSCVFKLACQCLFPYNNEILGAKHFTKCLNTKCLFGSQLQN